MVSEIIGLIETTLKPITDMIDNLTTTKEEKIELKNRLEQIKMDFVKEITKQKAEVIKTEAKSESWITRSWRPLIMLLFGIIIANNYILYPYLSLFFHNVPKLQIPPDMWQLLKIGLGGYVVGRTVEKVVKK